MQSKDVYTSIEITAPVGADMSSLDFDDIPCTLNITDPDGKSLSLKMNASAMLHMLVGLIADLGQLTGHAHLEMPTTHN